MNNNFDDCKTDYELYGHVTLCKKCKGMGYYFENSKDRDGVIGIPCDCTWIYTFNDKGNLCLLRKDKS